MKWLDSAMAPAVIIVVVFISPFVYWTFDRPEKILDHYSVQLRYEQSDGYQNLHYLANFTTIRRCKFSAEDEIYGPAFIIMEPTPITTTTLGRVSDMRLTRSIPEPLRPGRYNLVIFFSFWCNPVQRWANWPIVQVERKTFMVEVE